MAPTNGGPGLAADYARIERAARSAGPVEMDRQSNGLRQFFENLRGETRLHILDLGGVSQANVNFVTLRGHKLYTGDLLVGLDRVGVAPREPGKAAGPTARFIKENLNFPPAHFDGILVWDSLEFLDEEMLWAAVSSLQAILKPGGCLLSFFHTHAKGETVHIYRYQIRDHQTLHLQPRCSRPLPRAFNNRNLERLFGNFHAVKFFLAKDNLREVIVTR
ncbi:MAG: class I SAM-dependent methyltransferase [Acidobacteria bacterium]|nr:class I SAM-dependent methyltransferase [Acidobacteriota bacterium]